MKPTVESLKNMTSDPDCVKVVNALFEAIAYEQTVRELIIPKQQEVIDFFKFETTDEWAEKYNEPKRVITKQAHLCYISDDDFTLYEKEMHDLYIKSGFDVKYGYCPLLISERMTRDVKIEVCNFLEPYIGISYDHISGSLERYRQYYELIMTMFASAVKEYQKVNPIKKVA